MTAPEKLFEYMLNNHNVILLEVDMAEIQSILEPYLVAAERRRIKKELLKEIKLYNDNEMFGYSVAKNAIDNL